MNKFENFERVELANDLNEGELVKKAQEWGSKLWEILAKEGGGKGGTGTVRQQIIRSLAPGPVKL